MEKLNFLAVALMMSNSVVKGAGAQQQDAHDIVDVGGNGYPGYTQLNYRRVLVLFSSHCPEHSIK